MTRDRPGVAWSGLALGVLAVAVSTEAGYSLAYRTCGTSPTLLLLIAAGALIVALTGGLLSARAWRGRGRPGLDEAPERARPSGMMAGIGALASLLFSLVILLQGAAGLIISGCLR
jgi:hypothetical protein